MEKGSPISQRKRDRRGLLTLVGAGGAAAVAALLSRSNGAQAHGTIHADSATPDPAIHGDNTDGGPGIEGTSNNGAGVSARSLNGTGVFSEGNTVGVQGVSHGGEGVTGESSHG